MRKLKGFSIFGLLLLFGVILFYLPTEANAQEEVLDELVQPIELTITEKEALINLGFSNKEIDSMTEEEYQKYADLDGELTSKETKYYEVTEQDEGEPKITQVTEQQALKGTMNKAIMPFATDTKKSSWITLTLTSTKLSNGNTLLKNSFLWLSNPNVTFKDFVGITHSASAVKVPNTQNFVYKYRDGVGQHTKGALSFNNSAEGTVAKFDIVGIGSNVAPFDHNGYISFEVKKGNLGDIRANAYGHYDHLTIGITGSTSIGIKTGSISIGGLSKLTKATSPMILFNY